MSAELLRLAERCEKETATRKLDGDIALLIGWEPTHDRLYSQKWAWTFPECRDRWGSFDEAFENWRVPRYTSSIDAAMSLLGNCPIENMSWWPSVPKGYESEQRCRVTVRDLDVNGFAGRNQFKAEAATPALALTAAALRALSSRDDAHQEPTA